MMSLIDSLNATLTLLTLPARVQRIETHMSAIDDEIAALQAAEDALATKTRDLDIRVSTTLDQLKQADDLIAVLQAQIANGTPSADDLKKLEDAIQAATTSLTAAATAIDAVDAPAPTPDPTPTPEPTPEPAPSNGV